MLYLCIVCINSDLLSLINIAFHYSKLTIFADIIIPRKIYKNIYPHFWRINVFNIIYTRVGEI